MANGNFAGGNGTVENPYLIEDAFDLNAVRNNLSANYKMIKDIDLNIAPYNEGEGWKPIGYDLNTNVFAGIFEGNGHIINGLFIKRQVECQGLFGYIHRDSVIKNVCLKKINMVLTGHNSGGLAGINYGTISNCCVFGIVTGYTYSSGVGGLCGTNERGIIKNCYSGVTVSGGTIGRIVGASSGQIINTYSIGNVASANGYGYGITAPRSGGVITNSYWNIDTVGSNILLDKELGKTTLEMKTPSTFTDWDKEILENGSPIWVFRVGEYPKLWFEKDPDKFLIKQNNQYYTINSDYYKNGQFTPLSLNGISSPNKTDYTNFGFNNLNDLCINVSINEENFKPIDKFKNINNHIQILKFSSK